jgi:hypothetical protein
MGNICGKESATSDSFSTPGRTLGSSAAQSQPTRASVPAKVISSTPGRTLGGRESPEAERRDARSAAARAAEVRHLWTVAREEILGCRTSLEALTWIFLGASGKSKSDEGEVKRTAGRPEKANEERYLGGS